MIKEAFVPIIPFPIKDKAEYNSSEGKRKREMNEIASRASGAGVGLVAGAVAGAVGGYLLSKIAPGKMNIPVRIFDRTKERSGYDLGKGYVQKVISKTGVRPTTMPPIEYLPIFGGVTGAAAGMFPAEYKAKTKMQENVGIKPMTKKEFARQDIYPTLGAVGIGVIAADAASKALSSASIKKLTGSAKCYRGTSEIGPLGIGIATEVAAEKYLTKLINKDKENTMDKKASTEELYDKIAQEALEFGYNTEMETLEKDAFVAVAPFNAKDDGYDSTMGVAKEYANRSLGSMAGAGIGAVGGGAMGLLLSIAIKGNDHAIPTLMGAIGGSAIGSRVGDYRSLRKSERKTGVKETNIGQYVGRGVGNAFVPILGDAVVSRHLQDHGQRKDK